MLSEYIFKDKYRFRKMIELYQFDYFVPLSGTVEKSQSNKYEMHVIYFSSSAYLDVYMQDTKS